MTPEEIEAQKAELAAKELGDQNEAKGLNRDGTPKAPSQKNERSEKEKAEYTLKKNAERVVELGGDPAETLNIRPVINLDGDLDDDRPLTVKDFRELQTQDAHKTSLQLAEELPDDERDEVKELLQNRIKPSGDAEGDLRLARAAVNAQHNAQIAEHISNRTTPKRTAAGGSLGAPAEPEFVPTPEEALFMKHPYNTSKEKILAARKAQPQ